MSDEDSKKSLRFGSMKNISDLNVSIFLRLGMDVSQIGLLWSLGLLEVDGVLVTDIIWKGYKLW